jgi:hypothetical protein
MSHKNKGALSSSERLRYMAERTGLEPATPGVTGRYSNRLNYRSLKRWAFTLSVLTTFELLSFASAETFALPN